MNNNHNNKINIIDIRFITHLAGILDAYGTRFSLKEYRDIQGLINNNFNPTDQEYTQYITKICAIQPKNYVAVSDRYLAKNSAEDIKVLVEAVLPYLTNTDLITNLKVLSSTIDFTTFGKSNAVSLNTAWLTGFMEIHSFFHLSYHTILKNRFQVLFKSRDYFMTYCTFSCLASHPSIPHIMSLFTSMGLHSGKPKFTHSSIRSLRSYLNHFPLLGPKAVIYKEWVKGVKISMVTIPENQWIPCKLKDEFQVVKDNLEHLKKKKK
jgi:hypothetical protein